MDNVTDVFMPDQGPARRPGPPQRHRASSVMVGGSVLVTGEVAWTTGYEPGFPPQDAWLDGVCAPDPLVLAAQSLESPAY